MFGAELDAAIQAAVRALPESHLFKLAERLKEQPVCSPAARAIVANAVPTRAFREAGREVCEAWERSPRVPGREIAIALQSAATAAAAIRATQSIDIVWTGPASTEVPVRLTREVLLEIIGEARSSLIIVSFAAYEVAEITAAVSAAATRGVEIRMVLETNADSKGGPRTKAIRLAT